MKYKVTVMKENVRRGEKSLIFVNNYENFS